MHLLILLLLIHRASPASYHPQPTCVDSCNADHSCTSLDSCVFNSTSDALTRDLPLSARCPSGYNPASNQTMTPDRSNCHETGCDNGLCSSDELEVDASMCTGSPWHGCPTFVCKKRNCCGIIDTVKCCPLIPCHIEYGSCQVPHQSSSISSSSSVTNQTIAHNSSSVFPFYLSSRLAAGRNCSSVRVFGQCRCNDGDLLPGCNESDSSSWESLEPDLTDGSLMLPANLSLTCASSDFLPPSFPLPHSPSPPSPTPPPSPHPSPPPVKKESNEMSGLRIALIVISSTLLGLITISLSIWLGFITFLRQRLQSLRLSASYEPVTSGNGSSNTVSTAQKRGGHGGGGGFLDSLRDSLGYSEPKDIESSALLLHPQQQTRGHNLSYLPRPAVPEEDDVFTLEDLEDTLRPRRSLEMQSLDQRGKSSEEDGEINETVPLRSNRH